MKAKNLSAVMVVCLALMAAVVAVGLIAGYSMWPFIVFYWMVLTVKNAMDYIGLLDKKAVPENMIKPEKLDEDMKRYLSAMSPTQRLRFITEICSDFDGARTLPEMTSLLREIWAYADYPTRAE